MEAIRKAAARGLTVSATDGKPIDATGGAIEPKTNKYNNRVIFIDGIRFPSQLEGNRYLQLKMMVKGKMVKSFDRQVVYKLDINGVHICKYIADFVITWEDGTLTVEDTKGVETPDFKIKKKLMLAILGIEVVLFRLPQATATGRKSKRTIVDYSRA